MLEPDNLSEALSRTPAPDADRKYVRFAALGDSATHGLGDLVGDRWRGWARLLAGSIAESHDISFCNLAASGATAADVRNKQLRVALAHRPHLASLVVGLNDTMRSTWDPAKIHDDLLRCADDLAGQGALLMTVRFHDHSRVFGLPSRLARPMSRRIDMVNAVFDEIDETYGGIQVDLDKVPQLYDRAMWSIDRMHPSELGHRTLAICFAELLHQRGLSFGAPSPVCTSQTPSKANDAVWLVTQGAPWLGRRAWDLGPWIARQATSRVRTGVAW